MHIKLVKDIGKSILTSSVICLAFMEILDILSSTKDKWYKCSYYNYIGEGPYEVILAIVGFIGIIFIIEKLVLSKQRN